MTTTITGATGVNQITDDAITYAKLPAGSVINVTTYTNNTRQALSAAPSIVMASFALNKKSSTSTLVIQGSISGHTPAAGALIQGWKLGSGTEAEGQAVLYTGQSWGVSLPTSVTISGHTTTGSQTMVFRFYTNSGVSETPFTIYNPNSTDSARYGQTSSVFTVTEVEL